MASTRRWRPGQREARIRRGEDWTILAMGGVAFLFGLVGLAYVAGSIWAGAFDAKPRGSPRDAPPILVYASEDPVEFYGSMAFLGVLCLGMGWFGVSIMRDTISESHDRQAAEATRRRPRRTRG